MNYIMKGQFKMNKRMFLVFIVCITSFLPECTPNYFLNKSYNKAINDSFTLAIIPFYGDLPIQPDSAFDIVFQDTTGKIGLVSPSKLRNEISSDDNAKDILQAIFSKDYSPEDKNTDLNIKDLIGVNGLKKLKNICENADYSLIPIQFHVGPSMGSLFALTKFRLYDLNSGQLIYEVDGNLNTALGYPDADIMLTLQMVGMARNDFDKLFIKKSK